jgi:hypothetical protein
MANPQEVRANLSAAYPGKKWKLKVSMMSDLQALAIYLKLIKQGKIKL